MSLMALLTEASSWTMAERLLATAAGISCCQTFLPIAIPEDPASIACLAIVKSASSSPIAAPPKIMTGTNDDSMICLNS